MSRFVPFFSARRSYGKAVTANKAKASVGAELPQRNSWRTETQEAQTGKHRPEEGMEKCALVRRFCV
jgi:hypothetical protein